MFIIIINIAMFASVEADTQLHTHPNVRAPSSTLARDHCASVSIRQILSIDFACLTHTTHNGLNDRIERYCSGIRSHMNRHSNTMNNKQLVCIRIHIIEWKYINTKHHALIETSWRSNQQKQRLTLRLRQWFECCAFEFRVRNRVAVSSHIDFLKPPTEPLNIQYDWASLPFSTHHF